MIESKYLKKEDVGEDGVIVTIAGFDKVNVARDDEPPEYKYTMRFEEFEKPMVLNTTNIQLCEKALGSDDTDHWLGKQIIVYNEPNISFGNKLVGGIRIKAHRKSAGPRQMSRPQPSHGRSARDVNAELDAASRDDESVEF